ncbi:MAG: polysulfide reductase NrfD [Desulfobacteraceae bacterium]|nr:polysulfide reductase NrfD [Desulfobacteraceae bacterium]
MEITVTGANALAYPSLHAWNWTVGVYLFLIGAAAGLLVLSGIGSLGGDSGKKSDSMRAAGMAPFALMLGAVFIWLDLENKAQSYWFFLSFSPSSAMSWGGWALAVTVPVSLLHRLSAMPVTSGSKPRSHRLEGLLRRINPLRPILARACIGLGIFLGTYTGLVLSLFIARPLWNSPLLPVLSLVSAMSTGAALIVITARTQAAGIYFTKANIWLLSSEILVMVLYLLGHLCVPGPRKDSIMRFVSGGDPGLFLGTGYALAALIVPLALCLTVLKLGNTPPGPIPGKTAFAIRLGAFLIVCGGLVLRLSLVYFGQLSGLS